MIRTAKLDISHSAQLPPLDIEPFSAKGRMKGTDSVISDYQLRF